MVVCVFNLRHFLSKISLYLEIHVFDHVLLYDKVVDKSTSFIKEILNHMKCLLSPIAGEWNAIHLYYRWKSPNFPSHFCSN